MAVSCSSNDLLNNSVCLECIPDGLKDDVVIYLLCQIAGITPDPNALIAASVQFQSLPKGIKQEIIAYLTCQAANAAGA